MSKEKQHSPQHEELIKRQALEQQEVTEVLVFIRKYAKPAAIVLVLICAIVLVDKAFKAKRYTKETNADSALMNAKSMEDLQQILDKYGNTPSAPAALIGLAREKFNEGNIDEAEALYTQFCNKYNNHELALQAELNLISCIEAKGQRDEAQELYTAFSADNPESYLVPMALIGKARCLETLGRIDEAQITYEDLIVNFSTGNWAQLAQAKLDTLLANK